MPVMTKTPAGEDIVILSRVEYDALVASAEDAADAANANRILNRVADGTESILSEAEMDQLLAAKTPLAFWRKKRNLTQAQLSEATGVAQGFLSEIENGNKTGDVQTLVKIARTLAISIDDLVVDDAAATTVGVTTLNTQGAFTTTVTVGPARAGIDFLIHDGSNPPTMIETKNYSRTYTTQAKAEAAAKGISGRKRDATGQIDNSAGRFHGPKDTSKGASRKRR